VLVVTAWNRAQHRRDSRLCRTCDGSRLDKLWTANQMIFVGMLNTGKAGLSRLLTAGEGFLFWTFDCKRT